MKIIGKFRLYSEKKRILLYTLSIFVLYLCYFLFYYQGMISQDYLIQFNNMAEGFISNTTAPLQSAWLIAMKYLSSIMGFNFSIAVFSLVQGLFTAFTISLFFSYLEKYTSKNYLKKVYLLLVILNPIVSISALYLSNYTFTINFIVLYLLINFKLIVDNQNIINFGENNNTDNINILKQTQKDKRLFLIFSFILPFISYSGIWIVLLTLIFMFFKHKNNIFSRKIIIFIIGILVVLVNCTNTLLLQNDVYKAERKFAKFPLFTQTIAGAYNSGAVFEGDYIKSLESIMPKHKIEQSFNKYCEYDISKICVRFEDRSVDHSVIALFSYIYRTNPNVVVSSIADMLYSNTIPGNFCVYDEIDTITQVKDYDAYFSAFNNTVILKYIFAPGIYFWIMLLLIIVWIIKYRQYLQLAASPIIILFNIIFSDGSMYSTIGLYMLIPMIILFFESFNYIQLAQNPKTSQ